MTESETMQFECPICGTHVDVCAGDEHRISQLKKRIMEYVRPTYYGNGLLPSGKCSICGTVVAQP